MMAEAMGTGFPKIVNIKVATVVCDPWLLLISIR